MGEQSLDTGGCVHKGRPNQLRRAVRAELLHIDLITDVKVSHNHVSVHKRE